MWMKTYTQCQPTIEWRNTIMAKDWNFMSKEIIKVLCVCENKSLCLHAADLLENWHRPEARTLLDNTK